MGNVSDWYPPSKYIFYPLYKFYRKKVGLNMYVANFSVWMSGAVLHTAIFMSYKDYTKAVIFGGILIGLGTLSTGVKLLEKNLRNKPTLEEVMKD